MSAGPNVVLLGETGSVKIGTVDNLDGSYSIRVSGGGGGGVSSVGLSAPAQFTVTGSPVTTTGTLALAWNNQNANLVLAGPATGEAAAPTFRALVAADIPSLSASYVPNTGTATNPVIATSVAGASGTATGLSVTVAVSQSGTAAYQGLLVAITESATGSGTKYGLVLTVGGTDVWHVGTQGSVTTSGGYTQSGSTANTFTGATTFSALLTATLGETISGGTINLNVNSNNAVNIATGTSNALVTIGGGSGTFAVSSASGMSLTAAGAISGLTTINASGLATITGGVTISGSAASSISTTSNTAGAITLNANGGTSETILIRAQQGTSATSVNIVSTAGGVTLNASSAVAITNSATVGGTLGVSGNVTITSANLSFTGSITSAAWTTNGIAIKKPGASYTDSSSSGTVALACSNFFGGDTITAVSSTTYTSYATISVAPPVAGANVTINGLVGLFSSGIVLVCTDSSTALRVRNAALTNSALSVNGASARVAVGVNSGSACLSVGGVQTATAWNTSGIGFQFQATTFTDSSSSGTVARAVAYSWAVPTFAASSSTTYTVASSLYIAGAPTNGTNVTITTGYALEIAAGGASITGSTSISSTTNAAATITINANGGTSETILIRAQQGTSATSVNIVSTAGGVTLNASSAVAVTNSMTVGTTLYVTGTIGGGKFALTDASTVAIDLSKGNMFTLLTTSGVGATRKLGNPTNAVAGTRFCILIQQAASGGPYSFTLDTNYDAGGIALTLDGTASKVQEVWFSVVSSTQIHFLGVGAGVYSF